MNAGTIARRHALAPPRTLRDWWPALGVVLAAGVYATLLLPGSTVDALVEEDGWYETAGTIGLAAAAVCFGLCAWRLRGDRWKAAVFAVLAVGLFLAAGEEISWGQRIFGVDTPGAVEERNTQGELNLHNLEGLQGKLDIVFQLFWAGLFVAVPVLAAVSARASDLLGRWLPIAPLSIAVLLTGNYLLAQAAERGIGDGAYESIYPLGHSVTEIKEAVVGVILGVAAWLVLRREPART